LSSISSSNEGITSSLPQNPSDPLKNRADDMSNEHNLTVQSTIEDAKFNERQRETFSLSLKPGSSGPSSRENLANIAERSSSGASSRPEVKPQQIQKVDAPSNPSTNMPPPNIGFMNYQPMSNMEAMGINTERPSKPQYAVESSRISTFCNWPTDKHQTPEALGSAGFYFAGNTFF
jgi:hypothetical protein